MDDIFMDSDSFYQCLSNLAEVVKRCDACNLVLNLEKMSFYGERRYSVGTSHIVEWVRVDRAKIEVFERLPLPISLEGVRSFLGHVDFYRRFIKDF